MMLFKTCTKWFIALLLLIAMVSCSTSKNTASVRFWKSFKTKYNTYYNGKTAYDAGMDEKLTKNVDNYLSPIPLLLVGNEKSKSLGSGQFETAIKKCEKAIQIYGIHKKPVFPKGHKLTAKEKALKLQTEFNPYLKNAWILMGMAQMQKGDFIDASATFSYASRIYKTQPDVMDVARCLQAVCYIEMESYYDAEDLLDKVRRDSIPKTCQRYYNMALADLTLHRQNWAEAIPYVEKEVKCMKHGLERARGNYLLAQLYQKENRKKDAYNALNKCMRQNPPYEMRLNAQVKQTEVMSKGGSKRQIDKLKALARKTNNKTFLDQIYYAIGNIYLSEKDTVQAIEAYEQGRQQNSRATEARGVLLLALGNLYWDLEKFSDAGACYRKGLNGLKAESPVYIATKKRTEAIQKLSKHTDVLFEQDSLQSLTRMTEEERNKVIDKAIAVEKLRQKEAERQRKDSIAQARKNKAAAKGGASSSKQNQPQTSPSGGIQNNNNKGTWYFYDENTVMNGQELFQKEWGKRNNVDNWRVTEMAGKLSAADKARNDSIQKAKDDAIALMRDSIKREKKKKKTLDPNDPTNKLGRAYYLAQLPFSEEQLAESNKKIEEALYGAGIVEMDMLENYNLAHKTLTRLYNDFPAFKEKEFLLYKLFLLESRWGNKANVDMYKQVMVDSFPEGKYTLLITDPDYEEKMRYGTAMEDSIYAATYNAFKVGDFKTIKQNCELAQKKYPTGLHHAKFLFMQGMNALHEGNIKAFAIQMDSVSRYKKDDICRIAIGFLRGVKSGKKPIGGEYSMADFWESRRLLGGQDSASLKNDTLSASKNEPFMFILQYHPEQVNEGKLLYNISKYNFTTFAIRNFDLTIAKNDTIHQLIIEGFSSYEEVYKYTHDLFRDSLFKTNAKNAEVILISKHNAALLETKYTQEEYRLFYKQYFVPLPYREHFNLDNDPTNFIWDEFEEVKKEEEENTETEDDDNDNSSSSSEWY